MIINGDSSVFLGAIIVWLSAVVAACEAIQSALIGDWGRCAFKAVASFGLFYIGYRVWKAA